MGRAIPAQLAAGDLDLIHSAPLTDELQAKVAQVVAKWSPSLLSNRSACMRADLCPLERKMATPMLAQCVIPAGQLLLTEGGIVDAAGGMMDIHRRQLRIFMPGDPRIWDWNPQYLSASVGMAVGILIWINLSLVMQIVSYLSIADGRSVLQPDDVNAVRAVVNTLADTPDSQRSMFGPSPLTGHESLTRRFTRTYSLLGMAQRMNIDCGVQDELVQTIQRSPRLAS